MSPSDESIGIALPVRQWSHYAEEAIESFISFARPIDKLVISIDGSKAQKEKFSELAGADDRISVVQTPKSLSMAGHYEWCIPQLSTDWITVLGQDDALQFNFRQVTSAAIDFATVHGVDAISFRRAYFNWNDGTSELLGYGVKYAPGSRPRRIHSKRQTALGLLGLVEQHDFPQIYTNNLVRRVVIEQIRVTQSGRVFLEPIPDTYSGVAVACKIGSYLRWPVPAFWTGTSNLSAGLKVLPTSSYPPHILLANSEGRRFGISQRFWINSDSSSAYVFSALLTNGKINARGVIGMLCLLITTSSVFASKTLKKIRSNQTGESNNCGIRNPMSNNYLSPAGWLITLLFGFILMPLQLFSKLLSAASLRIGFHRRLGWRSSKTDIYFTPGRANAFLLRLHELKQ